MHVITGLKVGGAESMLTRLCTLAPPTALVQKVVSLTAGGSNRQRLEQAGADVSDLGMVRNWPSLNALLDLSQAMRAFRPDVVQSWMYHADLYALAATMMSRRHLRPRVAWGVRCSDMDTSRYSSRLKQVISLCARLSHRPDAVVANSFVGRDVHLALGYHPRVFEVIPNGIDIERFRPDAEKRARLRAELGIPPDRTVVAQVARVDPMKDYDSLLTALSMLPEVEALLIGEGTQQLPGGPRLHRLGRRLDVPDLLTAADLIVSSSAFGEGFSNALAEGMACGLPAVATDVGDARILVGDTGRIVPPGQPQSFVDAIRALLAESDESRAARSQAARQHIVDNFSIDIVIGRFAEFYERLIG